MKTITKTLALCLLTISLVSCGKGTNPLDVVDSPVGNGVPALQLPVADSNVSSVINMNVANTVLVSGFRFIATGNTKVTIFSPAKGLVTSIFKESTNDGLNNTFSIKVAMDDKFEYKIRGLDTVTVGPGDYLAVGQTVGTSSSVVSNGGFLLVQLDLMIEGRAACPYSYFNLSGKNAIDIKLGTARPCQI